MILPARIKLSRATTVKFQTIKNKTGVTPNILARIALVKAIESESDFRNSKMEDNDGQDLNRDVLFGEHANTYDILLRQYISENDADEKTADIVSALIEIGAHKMGHIRSIQELTA